MGGGTGNSIEGTTREHGFDDNKKPRKKNRTGEYKKSGRYCPAVGSMEEGFKEIVTGLKCVYKVWGVDLTLFFNYFYIFI